VDWNHQVQLYPLGGIFLVVFGLSLVRLGAEVCLKVLVLRGLAHPSLGEHPLGDTFHSGEAFPLLTHLVLGVSSLGIILEMYFLEGVHLSLRATPSRARLVQGSSMIFEVPPFLGEITLQECLNLLVVQI